MSSFGNLKVTAHAVVRPSMLHGHCKASIEYDIVMRIEMCSAASKHTKLCMHRNER